MATEAAASPLLTPQDLVDRWRENVSLRTLERMRQLGTGPAFVSLSSGKKRGKVFYRLAAVEEYERSRERRSTSDAQRPAQLAA